MSQAIEHNRQDLGMVLGLIGVVLFGATTLALSALLLSERISAMTVFFAVAAAAVVWFGRKARIS